MIDLNKYSDNYISMYDELSGIWISTMIMKTHDFIEITKINSVQRFTQGRLQKALKEHLNKHFPTHSVAAVAMLPDGELVKVDCHTRAQAWGEGHRDMPSTLMVTVFHIDDVLFSEQLYNALDSRRSVETTTDHVYGSARGSLGYEPQNSGLFTKRGMRTALEVAINNGGSMSDETFRSQLRTPECQHMVRVLDEYKFKPSLFNAGFLGAIILSVLRDGETAMKFWLAVANGAGTKQNGQLDAIEMAFQFKADIDRFKSVKSVSGRPRDVHNGSSRGINNDYCLRVLPIYDAWIKGRVYKPHTNSGGWTTRSYKSYESAAHFLRNKK
ncbi:hypothetical protein L0B53_06005 [Vibrio sp. SS-MA-C1-2]|uniref:hypothetical protein n=1 Tax=Vibrio sp. SS-MA-C1-2 TaxID=2908646 RepID=UPI001F47A4D7|nr:hypothetical protein [Vibrio sp. SS-MA-C1-2]UJF19130.1 hypothetical protein L0B53_06005 [Vibrio sp. SS-MA-C1-2]